MGRNGAATRRTQTAIARARIVIAGIPTVEAAPVDERGRPIPRCRSRMHHKIGANVPVRKDGNLPCLACAQIAKAKATLRNLAGEAW